MSQSCTCSEGREVTWGAQSITVAGDGEHREPQYLLGAESSHCHFPTGIKQAAMPGWKKKKKTTKTDEDVHIPAQCKAACSSLPVPTKKAADPHIQSQLFYHVAFAAAHGNLCLAKTASRNEKHTLLLPPLPL